MAVLITILKTLAALWPFLKEMIIKNTSMKQAIKDNKLLTSLFVSLLFSLFVCYYLANLTWTEAGNVKSLTHQQTQWEYQIQTLKDKITELEERLDSRKVTVERVRQSNDWLREENNRLDQELASINATRERYIQTIDDLRERLDEVRKRPIVARQSQPQPEPTDIHDRLEWLREQEGY